MLWTDFQKCYTWIMIVKRSVKVNWPWAVPHLTLTPWRQRQHGVGSLSAAPCSWSWGSLVWCPRAPTAVQTLWATTTQYSRHCIPTTSSTIYMLHKHLKHVRSHTVRTTVRFSHTHACTSQAHLLEHLYPKLLGLHETSLGVCVPGGEELNEFVCLLVGFIGRILKVLQVIRCHEGQISNTACSAATTQTGRGGVGCGAEARISHWRCLPLSQEVRCI